MRIHVDLIPTELKERPQWVAWRYEEREGKRTKVPYCVSTGERASSTDPATWTAFEAAEVCHRHGKMDGIGFVFTADDPYVGIDLDQCRNPESGELTAEAQEWLALLDSYAEVTPSGAGVHVICRGSLPGSGRKGPRVEMYEKGRYFTMTGARLEGARADVPRRELPLKLMYGSLFPPKEKPAALVSLNGIHGDDAAILDKALRECRYVALWRGDWSGYPSQSEADLALAGRLAFFTGPDEAAIDRLFRQSGLMREKWDDPSHGRTGSTYGADTIGKALEGKGPDDFYRWQTDSRNAGALRGSSVVSVVSVVNGAHSDPPLPAAAAEAFYGLPGRMVRTMSPHTESSDAAILLSFLIGAGCLIGRSPYVYRDGARHGTNDFCCLVGRSAIARKGTSLRRVGEVFMSTVGSVLKDSSNCKKNIFVNHDMREDTEWGRLLLPGLGSGEGLVASLVEAEKDGDTDVRRLIVEEEFSRPLKVMRREGSVLSEMLRQAWDGGILASRTKGKSLRARGGHIALLAHITERELKEELGATSLFNGFGNRVLWVYTERSKSLPFGGGRPPIAPLVLEMQQVLDMAATISEVGLTDDAAHVWDVGGVYNALLDRPPGLLGAVTSRAEAHVTRLALLYAVLDARRQIDVPHLLAALAVWDLNERSCARIFGESFGDDYADVIYERLVEVYPQALTRTEIRDGFGRNAPAGRIPPALSLLQRLGKVECGKAESGGRPAEIWRAKMDALNDRNDKYDKTPLAVGRAAATALGYVPDAYELTGAEATT